MTAPTIELLPCPFCGSSAIKRHVNFLYCSDTVNCGAQIEHTTSRDENSVIHTWNTRAQSANTLPLDEVPEGWLFNGLYRNVEAPEFTAEIVSRETDEFGFGFPVKSIQANGTTPAEALRAAIKQVTP